MSISITCTIHHVWSTFVANVYVPRERWKSTKSLEFPLRWNCIYIPKRVNKHENQASVERLSLDTCANERNWYEPRRWTILESIYRHIWMVSIERQDRFAVNIGAGVTDCDLMRSVTTAEAKLMTHTAGSLPDVFRSSNWHEVKRSQWHSVPKPLEFSFQIFFISISDFSRRFEYISKLFESEFRSGSNIWISRGGVSLATRWTFKSETTRPFVHGFSCEWKPIVRLSPARAV